MVHPEAASSVSGEAELSRQVPLQPYLQPKQLGSKSIEEIPMPLGSQPSASFIGSMNDFIGASSTLQSDPFMHHQPARRASEFVTMAEDTPAPLAKDMPRADSYFNKYMEQNGVPDQHLQMEQQYLYQPQQQQQQEHSSEGRLPTFVEGQEIVEGAFQPAPFEPHAMDSRPEPKQRGAYDPLRSSFMLSSMPIETPLTPHDYEDEYDRELKQAKAINKIKSIQQQAAVETLALETKSFADSYTTTKKTRPVIDKLDLKPILPENTDLQDVLSNNKKQILERNPSLRGSHYGTGISGYIPVTQLGSPATRGDTKLEVRSHAGFTIGMTILIGSGLHVERRKITGFGSIIIDLPLAFDHDEGTLVIIEEVAPDRPPIFRAATRASIDMGARLGLDVDDEAAQMMGALIVPHMSGVYPFNDPTNDIGSKMGMTMTSKPSKHSSISLPHSRTLDGRPPKLVRASTQPNLDLIAKMRATLREPVSDTSRLTEDPETEDGDDFNDGLRSSQTPFADSPPSVSPVAGASKQLMSASMPIPHARMSFMQAQSSALKVGADVSTPLVAAVRKEGPRSRAERKAAFTRSSMDMSLIKKLGDQHVAANTLPERVYKKSNRLHLLCDKLVVKVMKGDLLGLEKRNEGMHFSLLKLVYRALEYWLAKDRDTASQIFVSCVEQYDKDPDNVLLLDELMTLISESSVPSEIGEVKWKYESIIEIVEKEQKKRDELDAKLKQEEKVVAFEKVLAKERDEAISKAEAQKELEKPLENSLQSGLNDRPFQRIQTQQSRDEYEDIKSSKGHGKDKEVVIVEKIVVVEKKFDVANSSTQTVAVPAIVMNMEPGSKLADNLVNIPRTVIHGIHGIGGIGGIGSIGSIGDNSEPPTRRGDHSQTPSRRSSRLTSDHSEAPSRRSSRAGDSSHAPTPRSPSRKTFDISGSGTAVLDPFGSHANKAHTGRTHAAPRRALPDGFHFMHYVAEEFEIAPGIVLANYRDLVAKRAAERAASSSSSVHSLKSKRSSLRSRSNSTTVPSHASLPLAAPSASIAPSASAASHVTSFAPSTGIATIPSTDTDMLTNSATSVMLELEPPVKEIASLPAGIRYCKRRYIQEQLSPTTSTIAGIAEDTTTTGAIAPTEDTVHVKKIPVPAYPKKMRKVPAYVNIPVFEGYDAYFFPPSLEIMPGLHLITGETISRQHDSDGETVKIPENVLLFRVAEQLMHELPASLTHIEVSCTMESPAPVVFDPIPQGFELVQMESVVDLPVGLEVSPGVKIASVTKGLSLPPSTVLIQRLNGSKSQLPSYMTPIECGNESKDTLTAALKMTEGIVMVRKPAGFDYRLGMELIRRPQDHHLPPGMYPVPVIQYPDGLEKYLDVSPHTKGLELVYLVPRFDFPATTKLTECWNILPRPQGMRLPPNVYILYPNENFVGKDIAVPELPNYVFPVDMPEVPYLIMLPLNSVAVEMQSIYWGHYPLPGGTVLGPGITVVDPSEYVPRKSPIPLPAYSPKLAKKGEEKGKGEGEGKVAIAPMTVDSDVHREVNVLVIHRKPGCPLPDTLEVGCVSDFPRGVLLERDMEVVKVSVRFELPAGVKMEPGVLPSPRTQLPPGTVLDECMQVQEWPHGMILNPGLELVELRRDAFLPYTYQRVHDVAACIYTSEGASEARYKASKLPQGMIIVKMPSSYQSESGQQLSANVTVGIESMNVIKRSFEKAPPHKRRDKENQESVPLPKLHTGLAFAVRASRKVPLPAEMTIFNKTLLSLDTLDALKRAQAANVSLEVVKLAAHYSLPPGTEVIKGLTVKRRPFWLHLPSNVELVSFPKTAEDRIKVQTILNKKGIRVVNLRPEMIRSSASTAHKSATGLSSARSMPSPVSAQESGRNSGGESGRESGRESGQEEGQDRVSTDWNARPSTLNTKTGSTLRKQDTTRLISGPLPPDTRLVLLPSIYEVYAWGRHLPGYKAVSSSEHLHLPPCHFLVERSQTTPEGDSAPEGFVFGLSREYRKLFVPLNMQPNVEIIHLRPSYHYPLGINTHSTAHAIWRGGYGEPNVSSSSSVNSAGSSILEGSVTSSLSANSSSSSSASSASGALGPIDLTWNFADVPQLSPGQILVDGVKVVKPPPYSEAARMMFEQTAEDSPNRACLFVRLECLDSNPYVVHPDSDKVVSEVFGKSSGIHDASSKSGVGSIHTNSIVKLVYLPSSLPKPASRYLQEACSMEGGGSKPVMNLSLVSLKKKEKPSDMEDMNALFGRLTVFRMLGKDNASLFVNSSDFDLMPSAMMKLRETADSFEMQNADLRIGIDCLTTENLSLTNERDVILEELASLKYQHMRDEDLVGVVRVLNKRLKEKSDELDTLQNERGDTKRRMQAQMDVLQNQVVEWKEKEKARIAAAKAAALENSDAAAGDDVDEGYGGKMFNLPSAAPGTVSADYQKNQFVVYAAALEAATTHITGIFSSGIVRLADGFESRLLTTENRLTDSLHVTAPRQESYTGVGGVGQGVGLGEKLTIESIAAANASKGLPIERPPRQPLQRGSSIASIDSGSHGSIGGLDEEMSQEPADNNYQSDNETAVSGTTYGIMKSHGSSVNPDHGGSSQLSLGSNGSAISSAYLSSLEGNYKLPSGAVRVPPLSASFALNVKGLPKKTSKFAPSPTGDYISFSSPAVLEGRGLKGSALTAKRPVPLRINKVVNDTIREARRAVVPNLPTVASGDIPAVPPMISVGQMEFNDELPTSSSRPGTGPGASNVLAAELSGFVDLEGSLSIDLNLNSLDDNESTSSGQYMGTGLDSPVSFGNTIGLRLDEEQSIGSISQGQMTPRGFIRGITPTAREPATNEVNAATTAHRDKLKHMARFKSLIEEKMSDLRAMAKVDVRVLAKQILEDSDKIETTVEVPQMLSTSRSKTPMSPPGTADSRRSGSRGGARPLPLRSDALLGQYVRAIQKASPNDDAMIFFNNLKAKVESLLGSIDKIFAQQVALERRAHVEAMHCVEMENQILLRNLKAAEDRAELLDCFLMESKHKRIEQDYGVVANEILRKKVQALEVKISKLLNRQFEPGVRSLERQVGHLKQLIAIEKQLRFDSLSILAMANTEEAKLLEVIHQYNTHVSSSEAGKTQEDHQKQLKARSHYIAALKRRGDTLRMRATSAKGEIDSCTGVIVESIQSYQRTVQGVIPPKMLTKLLLWGIRTAEDTSAQESKLAASGLMGPPGPGPLAALRDRSSPRDPRMTSDQSVVSNITNRTGATAVQSLSSAIQEQRERERLALLANAESSVKKATDMRRKSFEPGAVGSMMQSVGGSLTHGHLLMDQTQQATSIRREGGY